jgi:hypothetical protein
VPSSPNKTAGQGTTFICGHFFFAIPESFNPSARNTSRSVETTYLVLPEDVSTVQILFVGFIVCRVICTVKSVLS